MIITGIILAILALAVILGIIRMSFRICEGLSFGFVVTFEECGCKHFDFIFGPFAILFYFSISDDCTAKRIQPEEKK